MLRLKLENDSLFFSLLFDYRSLQMGLCDHFFMWISVRFNHKRRNDAIYSRGVEIDPCGRGRPYLVNLRIGQA